MQDILREMSEDETRKRQHNDLGNNIKQLQKRLRALQEIDQNLRDDLNNGEVDFDNIERYELPGDLKRTRSKQEEENVITVEDWKRFPILFQLRKRLLGHSMVDGISAWKLEDGGVRIWFDPIVMGKPYGPYQMSAKLMPDGRWRLLSHSLPPAVPLHQLLQQHNEGNLENPECTRNFLESIFRYIRCDLSRSIQLAEMKKAFPTELLDAFSSNHNTVMKLKFNLGYDNPDENSDDSKEDEKANIITVTLSLTYDLDGELPKQFELDRDNFSDEDYETLKQQCSVFYYHRLEAAVKEAF